MITLFAGTAFAQNDEIKKQLLELKEASYYDSARFFKVAAQTEAKLLAQDQQAFMCELYLYKGNYFYYILKLNEARQYFQRALTEAEKYKNRHMQILAQIRLAYVEIETGGAEKALTDMQELLVVAKNEKDHSNTAEILNFLGLALERRNKMQESVKLYLEGMNLAETYHLDYYNGVFRNNLGLIKFYSGQNDEALMDYTNGLKFALLDNNARLASHIKMNMCVVYINQKKFDKAQTLFQEVTEYSTKNNLPVELASVYINLASSLFAAGLTENAHVYIDSGILVLEKHKQWNELERAYLGKCDLLLTMQRVGEMKETLNKAHLLNEKTRSLENAATYYQLLYRVANVEKNPAKALENHLLYIRFKDSLGNLVNEKVIRELQANYDVQRKEAELEKERTKTLLLEKKNQEERFMKGVIIAGGLIIFVLFGLFSILLYSRKLRAKQEQFSQMLIKDIEAERHRIARDLHDDVGQSLSIIKSKVEQKEVNGSENLGSELSRVIEQTRQISRNLYPSYLEKIGLVRAVATLMEKVQSSTGIECSFEIDEQIESMSIEVKTHIYRVIQECVNNTIKHSGANALKLSLQKISGEFALSYRDNGKGFVPAKVQNGLGLLSIGERVKMIGGTFGWGDKNEKGFVLNIKFTG